MTDVTEAPASTEEQARRGRPRPAQTIERDQQVFDKIGENGSTRDELVKVFAEGESPLSPAAVYLSLYRLRTAGRIQRVRDGAVHRWQRTNAATAEAPAEPTPAV